MKTFSTLILGTILSLFTINLQAQVYVNQAASGNNDGTSWADAYTSLHDALANPTSDIWVAAGIYTTGDATADSTAVFEISTSLNFYGGFDGTETMLSERDFEENETILSADLLGDDVEDDFDTNRADNSRHVLSVTTGITGDVIINGFIVLGGNTSPFFDSGSYFRSGGGIYSLSPIQVTNCGFANNFGRSGGCIYLGGDASGSTITTSGFIANSSNSQSAGIFVDSLTNVTVSGCLFEDNLTTRGAFYCLRGSGHVIEECEFIDNENNGGFGGAFFNWNSQNLTVNECIFEGNLSGNAGAIYSDGREILDLNPAGFMLTNCTFTDNRTTTGDGGSMFTFRASMTISGCDFSAGNAQGSGGFLFLNGNDKVVDVTNCNFDNANISGWGGAQVCYGENSIFNISDCTYTGNVSSNLGGAIHCGFAAITNVDNCTFEANSAASGGAIALQNDSTEVNVLNSSFMTNQATNSGGAIFAGTTESSSIVSVDNCEFQGNSANFGAGILISENGDDDISTLDVHNSFFVFNVAESQAGAINMNDADGTITNTVFTNNIASDPGVGGAISTNATSNNDVAISIINTTFDGNIAPMGAGISQWMENDSGSLVLTLQNNILQNLGDNYFIENGAPEVISNGGNLDVNGDMGAFLTQPTDLSGLDPEFVDIDDFDYHLMESSPAINAGVSDGAPTTDIEGNLRDAMVDIGAYEFDIIESVDGEVIANQGALRIFPNPVGEELNFTLDNDWTNELTVTIFNIKGQAVQVLTIDKSTTQLKTTIPVAILPTGGYYLTISNGNQALVERLMKK